MLFTYKGKVVEIGDRKVFESGSSLLTVVVRTVDTYNGKSYPNDIPFDFWNDRNSNLENEVKVGDEVSVKFALSCRAKNGYRYVSLRGYELDDPVIAERDNGGDVISGNEVQAHETAADAEMPF